MRRKKQWLLEKPVEVGHPSTCCRSLQCGQAPYNFHTGEASSLVVGQKKWTCQTNSVPPFRTSKGPADKKEEGGEDAIFHEGTPNGLLCRFADTPEV